MKSILFYLFLALFTIDNLTFAGPTEDSSFEQIDNIPSSIGNLPEEMLIKIAEQLDALALVRLSRTNKEFLAFMMRNKFYFDELEALVLLSDRIAVEQNPAKFLDLSDVFTRKLSDIRTDRNLNLSPKRFDYLTRMLVFKNDEITLERISLFYKNSNHTTRRHNSDFLIMLRSIQRKNNFGKNNKHSLDTCINEIMNSDASGSRFNINWNQLPHYNHSTFQY